MKYLGLARNIGDELYSVVASTGWEPVPFFVTAVEPMLVTQPINHPDAAIITSPNAARFAKLPRHLTCLVQSETTAKLLPHNPLLISRTPRAEGLFSLLKQHFPNGGNFILVRAERSCQYLEDVTTNTSWQMHVWITHREVPVNLLPITSHLSAVLGLSPLQANLLGPMSRNLLRFAWGRRTKLAFDEVGCPATDWCEPKVSALRRLLIMRIKLLRMSC